MKSTQTTTFTANKGYRTGKAPPIPGGNRAQRRAFYAVARSKKPENKKLYAELMHRKNNPKTKEIK
jgi:hypothetical protein